MDSKKPKMLEIPQDLNCAIETVIRLATKNKYVIIGLAFSDDPPAIAILRNTKDDPVRLFQAATDLIKQKVEEGNIVEQVVTPVN